MINDVLYRLYISLKHYNKLKYFLTTLQKKID